MSDGFIEDGFVEDGFVSDDDADLMARGARVKRRGSALGGVAHELSMQEDRENQPMKDKIAHGLSAFGRGLDWTGLADEVRGVQAGADALLGRDGAFNDPGEGVADSYRRGVAGGREATAMGADESDFATTLGDTAGQMTGVLAGAVPAKAGIMAAKSIPTLVAKSTALGGGAGGVSGLGHAEGDAGRQALETAKGVGIGMAGGAVLSAAPMALMRAAPSLATTTVGQAARAPMQTIEELMLQSADNIGEGAAKIPGAVSSAAASAGPVLRKAAAKAAEKVPAAAGAALGGALGGGPLGAGAGAFLADNLLGGAGKWAADKIRGKPPVAPESYADILQAERLRASQEPKPPVAGPANAAAPTLDVPEPVPAMPDPSLFDPARELKLTDPARLPPQPVTSVGRRIRPAVVPDEAAGAADVQSAVSTPVLEPAPPAPPPAPAGGAVFDELELQAMAPKMEAPPPIVPDAGPVDPLIALAARARQRGIDQRFSVDGSRERDQLLTLNGLAERQAFFDDLAQVHGQQQTAPLAEEFALTMPSGAPLRSTSKARVASMESANTGKQEASGTPHADMDGNGPDIRRAFAESRAPIADDAAQGLALEAQGAASVRPSADQVAETAKAMRAKGFTPEQESAFVAQVEQRWGTDGANDLRAALSTPDLIKTNPGRKLK